MSSNAVKRRQRNVGFFSLKRRKMATKEEELQKKREEAERRQKEESERRARDDAERVERERLEKIRREEEERLERRKVSLLRDLVRSSLFSDITNKSRGLQKSAMLYFEYFRLKSNNKSTFFYGR